VVSHEIEPFVELADRAVGVDRGQVRRFDELPSDPRDRVLLLEQLAKG
jgi:hypothetical protein